MLRPGCKQQGPVRLILRRKMLQGGELLRIKTSGENELYVVAQIMHVTKEMYDCTYFTAKHEGNVFDLL